MSVRPRNIRPIIIDGDVARVTLTKGLEAIIDRADVPLVEQWNWHALTGRYGHAYAMRAGGGGETGSVLMHRALLGAAKGQCVDHRDGDGLNNRRANLRCCTHQENIRSQVLNRRNKLGVKGVFAGDGKFRACIMHNGRTIHLGSFATKEEAGAAYMGAAKALFGEFAKAS